MKSITQQTPVHPAATPPNLAQICRNSCQRLLGQLQRAKAGILKEFGAGLREHAHLLELAVNEAEALAWQTGFPELFFPALAAEKASSVARWHERQQCLQQANSRFNAAI